MSNKATSKMEETAIRIAAVTRKRGRVEVYERPSPITVASKPWNPRFSRLLWELLLFRLLLQLPLVASFCPNGLLSNHLPQIQRSRNCESTLGRSACDRMKLQLKAEHSSLQDGCIETAKSRFLSTYDIRPQLTDLAVARAKEFVTQQQRRLPDNLSDSAPVRYCHRSSRSKMIVFDKDGTLGDSKASFQKWAQHMTQRIQEVLKDEASDSLLPLYHDTIGWNAAQNECVPSGLLAAGTWGGIVRETHEFLNRNRDDLQSGSITLDDVQAWNDELGALLGEDPPLLDDLPSMMQICRELYGYKVAVCTSDDRPATDAALAAWGIDSFVEHSICGCEVTEAKPSAVPLQQLCKIVSTEANVIDSYACIVVGDTTADTGMAQNAGSGFCVAVLTGAGNSELLVNSGAHLILPHVGYIPSFLQWLDDLAVDDGERADLLPQ